MKTILLSLFLISQSALAAENCAAVCTWRDCNDHKCTQGGINVTSSLDNLTIVQGDSMKVLNDKCRVLAGNGQSEILLYTLSESRIRDMYLQRVWRIYDYHADMDNSCFTPR